MIHFFRDLEQPETRLEVIETFIGPADRTLAALFECFLRCFVVSYGRCAGSCPRNDFLLRRPTHQVDRRESSSKVAVLEGSSMRLFRALKFRHSSI